MSHSLSVLMGAERGLRVELTDGFVVGRAATANLQLLDEKLSREHCRFAIAEGAVSVVDVGSRNGVFVNGRRVTVPTIVSAADELVIGDTLLVVDSPLELAAARYDDTFVLLTGEPVADAAVAGVDAATPRLADGTRVLSEFALALAGATQEAGARLLLSVLSASLGAERATLLWVAGRIVPLLSSAGKNDTVWLSKTLVDTVVRERRAIAIPNVATSATWAGVRSIALTSARSLALVPVLRGDAVIGLIALAHELPNRFGAAHCEVAGALGAIAQLAGVFGDTPPPARAAVRPIGDSAAFTRVIDAASAAAKVSSTVLITGETGTGKEELGRFVHESSPRATRPFVVVNCGALSETLADSELFGHERGAFTGAAKLHLGYVEVADTGTLFLDEIGELSATLQVKLLRLLENRTFYRVGSTHARRVDLRILAATHRDLEADVRAGRFREDLFYRLHVLRLQLPPLRERVADIAALAHFLLARICARLGVRPLALADEAVRVLEQHAWPGNVRELNNVLERAAVLRAASPLPISADEMRAALGVAVTPRGGMLERVAAVERASIIAALDESGGKKSHAAQLLGISRPTLDKKIAELGIVVPK